MSKLIKFIFIFLFLLIIYLIYLIYHHLKNTEEHFNSIIEVHYDEEEDTEQLLYKFNLEDTNLTISSVKPTILVKNIMALYPIDNDIVYLLDSIHDLYKVNFNDESVLTIKISGSKVGYPVKIVGNVNNVYILSSEGYIYEIIGDVYEPPEYISGIIDIALCGDELYYITKEGQLFSYSSKALLIEDIYFIQIIGSGPKYLFGLTTSKSIKRIKVYTSTVDDQLVHTAEVDTTFTHTADTINIKLISSDSMFGYITDSNNFYYMSNIDANINMMYYHSNVKDAMFNGIKTEIEEETETESQDHRRIVLDTFENLHMSEYSEFGHLNLKTISNGDSQIKPILFAGINVNNVFVLIDKITPADPSLDVDLTNINTHGIYTTQCPYSNSNLCDLCDETNYDFSCLNIYSAINSLITGDLNTLCQMEDVPPVIEIVNTFTFYKYDNFREDNTVITDHLFEDNNDGSLKERLKRCNDASGCGFFVKFKRSNNAKFKISITPIPTQSDSNAEIYSKTLIHNINPTEIIYLDIYSDDTTAHRTENISVVNFYQYDGYDLNTVDNIDESTNPLENHLNRCANANNCGFFVMDGDYAYFKEVIDWNSTPPTKTPHNFYLISKTEIPNMIPTKYYRLYLNEDKTTHYISTSIGFYKYDGYWLSTIDNEYSDGTGNSLENHLNRCANADNYGSFVMGGDSRYAYFKRVVDWNIDPPEKTNLNFYLISKTKIPNMIPTQYYQLYLEEDGGTYYYETHDIDQPEICAQENEPCTCDGTVYYGRKLTENTSGDPVSFNEMVLNTYYTNENTESIICSHDNFGGDPLPDVWKQCWCVP